MHFQIFFTMIGVLAFAGDAAVTDLRIRKTGSDWPAFLGPGSNGKSQETGLYKQWPQGGPPMVWSFESGEGYSMPVVALGRLFHFDRVGDRARLTCLRSETGEPLWQKEYVTDYEDYYGFSTGPRSSPTVDGNRVYTYGVEGLLRCLDVTDGSLIWEVNTTQKFQVVKNFFGVGSAPIVEKDLLIVMVGGSPAGSPRIHSGSVEGNGTGIVAFDKTTGTVKYKFSNQLASYATPVVTTLHGRRRGFAFTRGGLLGFDPSLGSEDFFFPWRSKKLESVNAANPVVVDDRVLITESYGLGAAVLKIGTEGYEVLWKDPPHRNQSLASHWCTPIFKDGNVYGVSGANTNNAQLRCVALDTGKVRWSQKGLGRVTLLYADGFLISLGEYGTLRLIRVNPDEYQQVSEYKPRINGKVALNHPAWNAPILAHGYLYARGKDKLICLDLVPAKAN